MMPLLLALLGVALLGIAIFAPRRLAAEPAVSFAPRSATAPVVAAFESCVVEAAPEAVEAFPVDAPDWAALIDPRAAGCDSVARVALVDALATVETPWARDVLLQAQAEERDAMVRAALYAALGRGLLEATEV